NVTYDFFCGVFGNRLKQNELHPVDDLIARQGKFQAAGDARKRYFCEQFNVLRPWPLAFETPAAPENPVATKQRLAASRRQMLDTAEEYQASFAIFDDADTTVVQCQQLINLLKAKVRIQKNNFKQTFASETECRDA